MRWGHLGLFGMDHAAETRLLVLGGAAPSCGVCTKLLPVEDDAPTLAYKGVCHPHAMTPTRGCVCATARAAQRVPGEHERTGAVEPQKRERVRCKSVLGQLRLEPLPVVLHRDPFRLDSPKILQARHEGIHHAFTALPMPWGSHDGQFTAGSMVPGCPVGSPV